MLLTLPTFTLLSHFLSLKIFFLHLDNNLNKCVPLESINVSFLWCRIFRIGPVRDGYTSFLKRQLLSP